MTATPTKGDPPSVWPRVDAPLPVQARHQAATEGYDAAKPYWTLLGPPMTVAFLVPESGRKEASAIVRFARASAVGAKRRHRYS